MVLINQTLKEKHVGNSDGKPRVLAFAGSARKESFNRKLVQAVAETLRSHGAEVTPVDLADYPMPIYDGDVESDGMPENAVKFFELMNSHAGFLIACPERWAGCAGWSI